MKKLVQFGAGNIGRSFIGRVFSEANYEVIFIDINEKIISELNKIKKYRIIIKKNEEDDETIWVENVRAVSANNKEQVISEIANADIVSTSVGKGALRFIFPVIAEGLKERIKLTAHNPLNIIIAENIRNGSDYFQSQLSKIMSEDYPFDKVLGLVETSIGKMVPIMKTKDIEKDPLWVFSESYNNLIIDKMAFKGELPQSASLSPKKNIRAYVDRKLFIHNMGHAATAYLGNQYNDNFTYLYEALEVESVYKDVKDCMLQSANALNKEYPDDLFIDDLKNHIDDLLYRFKNKSLGDTIFRVGRDLYRKLSSDDRLAGALLLAKKHSCKYDKISKVILSAFEFSGKDENSNFFNEDINFFNELKEKGLDSMIQKVCNFSSDIL